MLKKLFFAFAIALCGLSEAEIIECQNFKEIYNHIDKETLIILDIDDTLLIPKQMVGCDEWFMHRLADYKKTMSDEDALENALKEWEAVRHLTEMMIVEPQTEEIIADLQNQGHIVMGLTTQGLALATRTSLQLKEQKIFLNLTAPSKEDLYFTVGHHGVLFRNGILFTSGQSKAESLKQLCSSISFQPKKILFINDKASHLKDLERYALESDIPFVGLRYGYSDFRKKAFSSAIADYQFSHSSLNSLMSDIDAKDALSQ